MIGEELFYYAERANPIQTPIDLQSWMQKKRGGGEGGEDDDGLEFTGGQELLGIMDDSGPRDAAVRWSRQRKGGTGPHSLTCASTLHMYSHCTVECICSLNLLLLLLLNRHKLPQAKTDERATEETKGRGGAGRGDENELIKVNELHACGKM